MRKLLGRWAVLSVLSTMSVLAQTPPGGVPIPTSADFGDPADAFGTEIAAEGVWAVITGLSGEAYYVYERVGNIWLRRQRIVPPTLGQTGPVSTELRGNRLTIARAFGIPGDSAGRVYVYERSSSAAPFNYVTTIVPADSQAGDRLGYGMALSDDRLFVAAPGRDEGAVLDQGVVYIFRNVAGTWTQEARLTLPDATPGGSERFGFGLDFDGQDLLIGARQHRPTPTTQGAVYVYRQVGGVWTQQQKLVHPGSTTASQFGYDVSAESGRAVIAAPRTAQRAVFFASRDGAGIWSVQALPDPVAGGAAFGTFYGYVDIEGNTIALSAQNSGPVMAVTYHFDGTNWIRAAQIPSTDTNATVAASVRISSGFLLVGAPGDDASARAFDQGSVSSYSLTNAMPTPRQRIWHGAGVVPDYLGEDLALDDDWALLLAPGADVAGSGGIDLGASYFMRKVAGNWNFAQSIPGDAALGKASGAGLLGDKAFIGYPFNQSLGLPNPIIRVLQRQIDNSWVPLCDLTFSGAGTTTTLGDVFAVSSAGLISEVRINNGPRQMVAFPLPTTGCGAGTLLPDAVGATAQYLDSISMSGTSAAIGWTDGLDRGVDIFEQITGNWTRIQTLMSTSGDSYFQATVDGNRLAVVHSVPVATIDFRQDIEIYERVTGTFGLLRTLTPSTTTGGFSGALISGNTIFVGDPAIGVNSGIAVYDITTGTRLQEIVPPGLDVEDDTLGQVSIDGNSAVLTYTREDRGGQNNAGMVYSLEFVPTRAPEGSTWVIEAMDEVPRPDRLFSDFFEDQAY